MYKYTHIYMHIYTHTYADTQTHICLNIVLHIHIYIYVYKNGPSPAFYLFFLCFGRGTSIARHNHGGGLALLESSRGYCRS